ncbi:MAG: DUF3800 domain-containing protein [Treponema sp.]|nr:DUF3800 domain-containing protein [Treponema sp.]
MKRIFFDESGNTGPDLLNKEQPLYILCSTDFNEEKARKLLGKYFPDRREVHFKDLKKSSKGRQQLSSFYNDNYLLLQNNCKVIGFQKDFTLVCNFLLYVYEPYLYENGFDFFDEGFNIRISNLFYYCFPAFCGKEFAVKLYNQFKMCISEKSDENNKKLVSLLIDARKNCSDKDFAKDILDEIIFACNDLSENLSEIDISYLDPSYSALINLIQLWMKDSHDSLEIWHDESNSVAKRKKDIDFLSKLSINPTEVGYGEIKATYPLNVKKLSFVESNNSASIQICDLVSSILFFVNTSPKKYSENFHKEMKSLFHNYQFSNLVIPSTDVEPMLERKRKPGEKDMVDFLAEQYYLHSIDDQNNKV